MSEIVSEKSKTFWPSCSADPFSKLPAAALLFQHCVLTGKWEDLQGLALYPLGAWHLAQGGGYTQLAL
eukprot:9354351-Lingulodinium_polyedra.AAC.1